MALTNFAALTTEELTVWSRDFWKMARNLSFINQFAGKGSNAMVQRITELTKSEKGARAVLTLVGDMTGDGVVGDSRLEDNEEALKSYDTVIRIDQMRNANRIAGRMADQKSVVNFRENSRDQLAYWLADRMDQIAFLTLAGVPYTLKNTGGLRPVVGGGNSGQTLNELEFAADVVAPSSYRHLRWDANAEDFDFGDTTAITPADTLSYKSLVLAKAYAKDQYIRGIKGPGGEELYHVFVCPQGMAKLKLDPDYLANVRHAAPRSTKNPLFAGTTSVMLDGLVIHEFRHVFNTAMAQKGTSADAGEPGYMWGEDADVKGQRVLICGAQALGFADIGLPMWEEETFDYKNQHGISIAKILGFLKPQFHSNVTEDKQDFGVLCLDTAI